MVQRYIKFSFRTTFLEKTVRKFSFSGKITYKDLMSKDEIWNSFLDEFNKKSLELMEYSNSTTRELDKIDAQLDGEG